jgi:tRNA (guanine37-N1)-methyltransferase
MRIDVISIFPDYLQPLGLSLPGKAQASGLLEVHVHDLRDWTLDRHRTVDDTPYGGGAGMVMKPEPWGEALDAVVPPGSGTGEAATAAGRTTLVVPTPSGVPFTQAVAAELASRDHLVFACGRYEGIDQRVVDEAATRMEVRELSIGDFVLNGGEVAALAIIEAVVRLLPGFMGNAASLAEESHADGLLEYPVYTKPARWRGHEVPEVLLSGDHARIAQWRRAQSLRRTVERRPDLAHPARAVELGDLAGALGPAQPADAGELLTLQRACWLQEEQANPGVFIPPLHEDLADVQAWLPQWTTLVLRVGGRLVGAARGRQAGRTWDIGRLMVAPDLQGRGLGRFLLGAIEQAAPEDVTDFVLFTGAGSERNQRMYRRAGYRPRVDPDALPGSVTLAKRRRPDRRA